MRRYRTTCCSLQVFFHMKYADVALLSAMASRSSWTAPVQRKTRVGQIAVTCCVAVHCSPRMIPFESLDLVTLWPPAWLGSHVVYEPMFASHWHLLTALLAPRWYLEMFLWPLDLSFETIIKSRFQFPDKKYQMWFRNCNLLSLLDILWASLSSYCKRSTSHTRQKEYLHDDVDSTDSIVFLQRHTSTKALKLPFSTTKCHLLICSGWTLFHGKDLRKHLALSQRLVAHQQSRVQLSHNPHLGRELWRTHSARPSHRGFSSRVRFMFSFIIFIFVFRRWTLTGGG